MQSKKSLIILSIVIGLGIWILDIYVDSILFFEGSLEDSFIPHIFGKVIYFHSLLFICFVFSVLFISRYLGKFHKTKQKLKSLESKYEVQFDEALDGIVVCNAESGIITDCNNAIANMLGRKKEELIGKHQSILHPPQSIKNGYSKTYKQHMHNSEGDILEELVITKDGSIKNVAIKTNTFEYHGEKCIQGIFRDITERKKADDKLRNAENRLKNTFNLSPGLISAVDTNTGYFVDCNPAVTSILGFSVEEFMSKPFIEYLHPDDRQRTVDTATSQLRGNAVANFENRYLCKDGSYKWLSWQATPADKDGLVYGVATDITDRKLTEDALRESEEKYKEVVEGTADLITRVNREGTLLFINPVAEDFFGIEMDRSLGMSAFEFIHPDDRKMTEKWFRECTQNKISQGNIENRQINQSTGKEFYMLWICSFYYDENGIVTRINSIGRDITDRKKAEINLKRSEIRLRNAQQTAHLGDWDWNITTGELSWSDETFRIFGFEPQAFKPTYEKFESLLHPEDIDLVNNHVDLAIKENTPYNIEFRIIRDDGVQRILSAQGQVLCDDKGKTTRFTGIQQDITKQKQAELELQEAHTNLEKHVQERTVQLAEKNSQLMLEIQARKQAETTLLDSEQRFRAVAYCTADFIWQGDVKTNSLEWTGDIDSCLGYGKGEFPRTISGHSEHIHPEDKDKVQKSVEKAIEKGYDLHVSYRIKCKDGSYRNWDERGRALKFENGKAVYWVGSVTDITDKVLLEEKAKQSQSRLIHTNKMTSLGTISSGIAHEINNPNSYILSNSQVLYNIWKDSEKIIQDRYDIDSELKVGGIPFQKLIHITPKLILGISEGSTRIKQIVDNLKNFSRPVNIQLNEKINVNAAIMTSTSMIGSFIQKYTDNFHVNCDNGLPFIKGNSQQIEQVVINLVINALQSLKDKSGKVLISTSHDSRKDSIVISVIDDGSGIPAELLSKIREPYFTTKQDSGGTGLGLAISNTIIKDHNGTMDFSSVEGKGTTVTITFPVSK